MVKLYQDPDGESTLKPSSKADSISTYNPTKSVGHPDDVTSLKQQISELQKKLAEV